MDVQWTRERGVLCTYVHPYGTYRIKKWSRGVRRVYLNDTGTVYYGTEDECMKAVQRVVNSMEIGRAQTGTIQDLQLSGKRAGPRNKRSRDVNEWSLDRGCL